MNTTGNSFAGSSFPQRAGTTTDFSPNALLVQKTEEFPRAQHNMSFFDTLMANIQEGFNSLAISVDPVRYDQTTLDNLSDQQKAMYADDLQSLHNLTRDTVASVKDAVNPDHLTYAQRQLAELPYEMRMKRKMELQYQDRLENDPILKNYYQGLAQEIADVSTLTPQNSAGPEAAARNVASLVSGGDFPGSAKPSTVIDADLSQDQSPSISQLMESSVTGGLVNDVTGDSGVGINTRSRVQANPLKSAVETESLREGLRNQAERAGADNENLVSVMQTPFSNTAFFGSDSHQDMYKHDTMGNPYINSHRIQYQDFHPEIIQQFPGLFDDQRDTRDEGKAIADIRQFLAASDDPQRDWKLAVSRYGTPEELDSLLELQSESIPVTQEGLDRLKRIGVGINGLPNQ